MPTAQETLDVNRNSVDSLATETDDDVKIRVENEARRMEKKSQVEVGVSSSNASASTLSSKEEAETDVEATAVLSATSIQSSLSTSSSSTANLHAIPPKPPKSSLSGNKAVISTTQRDAELWEKVLKEMSTTRLGSGVEGSGKGENTPPRPKRASANF